MNKFRALLYRLASVLGDVNAARKGKIGQRVVRKAATRSASRMINKVIKW